MLNIDTIQQLLKDIIHPLKEQDIVSLGIVGDIKVDNNAIKIKLLFEERDPVAPKLKEEIESAIRVAIPDKELKLSIIEIINPPKAKKKIEKKMDSGQLMDVKKIVAIASGKGGVGKSTIAVNLAIALSQAGYKVGLADADVYGPSIPKMTDTEQEQPMIDNSTGEDLILPIEKYGVKWISIGYFSKPENPLIWRGPMASNALKQMIFQVKWGELDFLLIDLPPGTGDIHISIMQEIPLSGAVVVSTPQAVALTDVEKGVNMFRSKDIAKPILGLVENMAWFTPAELPQNRYYIFGKEGCIEMAKKYGTEILAQIPIIQSIREGGDFGDPAALHPEREDGAAFVKLAEKVVEKTNAL